jgi:phage-related protein
MFEVVFFSTDSGNQPVLEWLRALTKDEKTAVGTDLRTVQLGFPIGMPVCRPLGDGLYETRSSLPSKTEARLIFFQDGHDLIIVAGFIKKTQATPKAELENARKRKSLYLAKAQSKATARKKRKS